MLASALLLLVQALALVAAGPLRQRQLIAASARDAAFTQSTAQFNGANLVCTNGGVQKRPGGVVLLLHGTASTGPETWQTGPYVQVLPGLSPTFDVCYISFPGRSLGDEQVTAEYIAYFVQQLAPQSATGKVALIAHSQGAGQNVPFALAYFPSIRPLISTFVSLAGDFRGTAEGPLACVPLQIAQGGCLPSVLQQTVGSNYLALQQEVSGSAYVPTTSIYTREDDIIQPEVGGTITSELPGAVVLAVQDDDVCGPLHVADHFLMTIDPAAFFLAYDALQHGTASTSRFNKANCVFTYGANLIQDFNAIPGVLRQALLDAVSVVADNPRSVVEPALANFVCDGQFGMPAVCAAQQKISSALRTGLMPATSNTARQGLLPATATTARTGLMPAQQRATTTTNTVNPAIGQLVTPGVVGTLISQITKAITNGEGPPATTVVRVVTQTAAAA